jgi:hypothetical protein
MKKIRLDIDALEVTSFPVDEAARVARGTVHGQRLAGAGTGDVDSCDETCWRDTCNPCGAVVGGFAPAGGA